MFLQIYVVENPYDRVEKAATEPLLYPFHDALTVGRGDAEDGPDVDLALFEAAAHGVSRIHARLQPLNGGLSLVDLASRNGTYINDMAIRPHQAYPLNSDDVIRLGQLHLLLELVRA